MKLDSHWTTEFQSGLCLSDFEGFAINNATECGKEGNTLSYGIGTSLIAKI